MDMPKNNILIEITQAQKDKGNMPSHLCFLVPNPQMD